MIDDTKVIPYQVTLEKIEDRHEQGLEIFYRKYPNAQDPIFITKKNAAKFI